MQIPVADGRFEAYVARPATVPAPAIIVIQEIFGVNGDIRQTCQELAARGYIAVAPDLFWRDAPGLDLNSWSEEDWKRGLALYNDYDLDCGVRDIEATLTAARRMDGASGKVGVMGFCLGGLMAYLTAARTTVDAAVSYYGGNTDRHLDEAPSVKAPLMMHLGEEDEFIPADARKKIRVAFVGNSNVRIHSYPGQSHAFARHTGAHYDASAAKLANARTCAFFEEHLRG